MLNSFRTDSEGIQDSFRTHSEFFRTSTELIHESSRSHSGVAQSSRWIPSEFIQKVFISHAGVIQKSLRSNFAELVQNSLKKSLMGHAVVNQNLVRTPSELIHKAFRVIQDSLCTHSEFVQNLVRSHSGFIQNSHSECIRCKFRTHSELIQKTFKNHSRAIH